MKLKMKDIKAKYRELFVVEKAPEDRNKPKDIKKMARDFWYGKPHEERRLGDLYVGDTGTYEYGKFYKCVSDGETPPSYSNINK